VKIPQDLSLLIPLCRRGLFFSVPITLLFLAPFSLNPWFCLSAASFPLGRLDSAFLLPNFPLHSPPRHPLTFCLSAPPYPPPLFFRPQLLFGTLELYFLTSLSDFQVFSFFQVLPLRPGGRGFFRNRRSCRDYS